ncbi:MAG: hypothetical protein JWM34_3453 [Ilumatobacteraceae bacterium]|nr:hypothetical protein [Ilumatobacteraceae bacterium]
MGRPVIQIAKKWFFGLSQDQQGQVLRHVGPLPHWMIASLIDAGLKPIPTALLSPDGTPAFMMPVELLTFFAVPASVSG